VFLKFALRHLARESFHFKCNIYFLIKAFISYFIFYFIKYFLFSSFLLFILLSLFILGLLLFLHFFKPHFFFLVIVFKQFFDIFFQEL